MIKFLFLFIGLCLLIITPCFSADHFETITVSSAAIGLTQIGYTPLWRAYMICDCTLETANVRIRMDGVNPTSSVGHLIIAGESFKLEGYDDISKFKAIRVSTDALLSCSCQ
jgi:hypothetical protein